MDLEQLIKQRDELIAEAEKMLAGRPATPGFERPIELQEAQAARVEARIASLETSRAELARATDLELKELKADLEQRRRKIALDRKEFEKASPGSDKPPPSTPARVATPAVAARKTAKPAPARKAGAASKAAKGIATRRAPTGKKRGGG